MISELHRHDIVGALAGGSGDVVEEVNAGREGFDGEFKFSAAIIGERRVRGADKL